MMSSKRLITLGLLLAVAGCGTIKDTQDATLGAAKKTDALVSEAKAGAISGAVWQTDAAKIAGDEIKVKREEKLPDFFEKRFTYSTPGQPIATTLEDISSRVGIRIVQLAGSNDGPAATPGPGPSGFAPLGPSVAIQWDDKFRGLMDYIGQKQNRSWRYVDGVVEFYSEETRTFSLAIPRKAKELAASISMNGAGGAGGGGGGGGSSGGGSGGSAGTGSVSVNSGLTLDPYAAVVATVQSIISQETGLVSPAGFQAPGQQRPQASSGGKSGELPRSGPVIASREFGIIQVTARPSAMRRVETFIDSINQKFSRNVFINVEVYNVDVAKEQTAGASLQAFYRQLNKFGARLQGSGVLLPSSGAEPGSLTATVTSNTSPFAGTEIVAQALRTLGDTTLETSEIVITPNGQPAPVQVANEVTWAAEVVTNQIPNAGITTGTKKDTRVVGFTANFTPLIQGDNRIQLESEITISSLKLIPSGTAAAPTNDSNVSMVSLQNTAYLNDGQSIVLFGYKQSRNESNDNRSFGSFSQSGKQGKSIAVVVVTVFGGSKYENF